MADGSAIKNVINIIKNDDERRFVVVSAPGKRFPGDIKVTDLLYTCHAKLLAEGTCKNGFAPVRARFLSIVKELNITFDIISLLDETERRINEEKNEDFTASRGEYLAARILAEVLGAKFIDAQDVIFFNTDGSLDGDKSYNAIVASCPKEGYAVFPGFYGTAANGVIKTFSRGGSDISGAIVARAVYASLYENWTDVSGFYVCDPSIISNPIPIKYLSYKELRELSYTGAYVLHSESIFPVRNANIPIQIKNTFRPQDAGTSILPSRHDICGGAVTGIAGKKNFTVIFIEKSLMNVEAGFMAKALGILQREGVPVEYIPSAIDSLSLVIESRYLKPRKLDRIVANIQNSLSPDAIRITENIALIVIVGHGITSSADTYARLFCALARACINVKIIIQGEGGPNVTVGVSNTEYEKCIRAIYCEFFVKQNNE